MAEAEVLNAHDRPQLGSRACHHLRKKGLIPAVLYGHGEQNASISLPEEELHRALDHGVRVVEIKHGDKSETAQIRDVQWDYLGMQLLHADFVRVSKDEKIQVEIQVDLRGVAPGVEAGGVLDHHMHSIEIECLPLQVPESIVVNINSLQMDQSIHVKDLALPEGVKALADPDEVVVLVREPEEEVEEEDTGPAEPEVIGRAKEDEESDED